MGVLDGFKKNRNIGNINGDHSVDRYDIVHSQGHPISHSTGQGFYLDDALTKGELQETSNPSACSRINHAERVFMAACQYFIDSTAQFLEAIKGIGAPCIEFS